MSYTLEYNVLTFINIIIVKCPCFYSQVDIIYIMCMLFLSVVMLTQVLCVNIPELIIIFLIQNQKLSLQ